jgi:integrase
MTAAKPRADDVEYARQVFVDLVSAWVAKHGAVPHGPDALNLVKRSFRTAAAFNKSHDQVSAAQSGIDTQDPGLFGTVARTWATRLVRHSSGSNRRQLLHRLERYVLPHIASRQVPEVHPAELLSIIQSVEATGFTRLAYQVFRDLRAFYRYAIVAGVTTTDATLPLCPYKRPQSQGGRFISSSESVGRLLIAINQYKGKTRSAGRFMLRLAPMLFMRSVELRTLEWGDVDLNGAILAIAPERMKNGRPHVVPLPRQAVELLSEVRSLTGGRRYVFSNGRGPDRPLSFGAFHNMLRSIGFQKAITPHGFRAMAATWLHEQGWRSDAIERQLSHVGGGVEGRSRLYNRAEYLSERREMMQAWADHLTSLEARTRGIARTNLDFSTNPSRHPRHVSVRNANTR